jgi:hypothetical protein
MKVIPMSARSDSGYSLIEFTDDVGIPERLVYDPAGKFFGQNTEFQKHFSRMQIISHSAKQGRKNQNHAAKREIRVLAKQWKNTMKKNKVPKCP